MKKNRTWKLFFNSRGGNRYFHEFINGTQTGKIGIADDSGDDPDKSGDGVWYVDTKTKLEMRDPEYIWVPIIKESDDKKLYTIEYWTRVNELSMNLGMKVQLPTDYEELKWIKDNRYFKSVEELIYRFSDEGMVESILKL
jgi:hypothetical protein